MGRRLQRWIASLALLLACSLLVPGCAEEDAHGCIECCRCRCEGSGCGKWITLTVRSACFRSCGEPCQAACEDEDCPFVRAEGCAHEVSHSTLLAALGLRRLPGPR